MDDFLGRNFVSGPRTLKPKKPKKNFLKKPRFFSSPANTAAAGCEVRD